MKIRLQIAAPGGSAFAFEHPGPALRIGRNPESELTFEGEASQLVSSNHAQLELTPSGAHLTDVGSTNGTFVNHKRISGKTRIVLGDEIQLGFTGPLLKVVELDLTPAPAPPRNIPLAKPVAMVPAPPVPNDAATTRGMVAALERRQQRMLLGIGLAGLGVLLVGILVWAKSGKHDAKDPKANGDATQLAAVEPTHPQPVPPRNPPTSEPRTTRPAPKPKLPAPVPAGTQFDPPSAERKALGTYIIPAKAPPSILLQRQSDPYPWGQLRPDSRVYTANYLVSLPGYRGKVYLDSGVHLTLWGNVPEFSNYPPVLESTVMLNVPADGIDLDLTLDHGRVHLANYKPQGAARVRVRFHRETWDLTLPDAQTEVVLELWGLYPREVPFSMESGHKGPLACLGLFARGPARLAVKDREYTLSNLSQVIWSNTAPGLAGPQSLEKVPDWWSDKIDPKTPEIADAMLALTDYHTLLAKTDAVVDAVLTQVRESPDAPNRALGILFLSALDAVPHLVDALENRQHPDVRGSATFALRHWMSRGADHDLELYRTLLEKKGYSREKAELIMRLLHSVSESDAAKPQTYDLLIGCLNHDNLAIRGLAFWHLAFLAPEGAKKIAYDPTADAEKRKLAVEQWKKLIPDGKVPSKPAPPARPMR